MKTIDAFLVGALVLTMVAVLVSTSTKTSDAINAFFTALSNLVKTAMGIIPPPAPSTPLAAGASNLSAGGNALVNQGAALAQQGLALGQGVTQ